MRGTEFYRRALARDPRDPAHRYNLAAALHAEGLPDEALAILHQGIDFAPGDARLHYGVGCIQQSLGSHDLAGAAFRKATDLDPAFRDAWYGLGSVRQSAGDGRGAAACYAKVLALDPDHSAARHLLASLTGQSPDNAEPFFVEQLFDHYASRYDEHVLDALHYRGHTLTASALGRVLEHRDGNVVLDLGCGTGLFGAEIAARSSRLIGVDLSLEMIKHAHRRECYDELHLVSLEEFTLESPSSVYDVVAATDVFSYVGDLGPSLAAVRRVLRPGGLLAFTVQSGTADFRLDKTGRYQHSKLYLDQQARRHGYRELSAELHTLRTENRTACKGWVCVWRKR